MVLEIVSVDANSPAGLKSIAWCLLPVTMAHISENEEAKQSPKQEKNILEHFRHM